MKMAQHSLSGFFGAVQLPCSLSQVRCRSWPSKANWEVLPTHWACLSSYISSTGYSYLSISWCKSSLSQTLYKIDGRLVIFHSAFSSSWLDRLSCMFSVRTSATTCNITLTGCFLPRYATSSQLWWCTRYVSWKEILFMIYSFFGFFCVANLLDLVLGFNNERGPWIQRRHQARQLGGQRAATRGGPARYHVSRQGLRVCRQYISSQYELHLILYIPHSLSFLFNVCMYSIFFQFFFSIACEGLEAKPPKCFRTFRLHMRPRQNII